MLSQEVHIEGQSGKWMNESYFNSIVNHLRSSPSVDIFASHINTQLPRFFKYRLISQMQRFSGVEGFHTLGLDFENLTSIRRYLLLIFNKVELHWNNNLPSEKILSYFHFCRYWTKVQLLFIISLSKLLASLVLLFF